MRKRTGSIGVGLLNAPDGSVPRSPAEQKQIWQAYQDLVIFAIGNLAVVTSQDLVKLAE